MITWFREIAPIREKMATLVAAATAMTSLASIASVIGYACGGPLWGLAAGLAITVMVLMVGVKARRAICDPYVTTVVRMEALATGDLVSPIQFTSYGDCVGRLSRGMLTFRDAAAGEIERSKERSAVVTMLGTHLLALSNGDLTATIKKDFPEDYTALKANFNEALDKLKALIGAVSESAAAIGTGSTEIAHASTDLAHRTKNNAASLEQTAASVTQMDGRLQASAEAASRTVARADQAIATVGGGRVVADEAVQAMTRVGDSAKSIDSVIEGLDKIAFQTRVLAMNAAVEAGRAGDAGRGFAVVADLVSALAMRAEEEAKRARDQLTVTQTDIAAAVEAVEKFDGALADISGDVGQVHDLLATMAADNQAQSAAITEISSAILTMDQATQQNAGMVEETSTAARNLVAEVGGLTEQAGRFKTGLAAAKAPSLSAPAKARTAGARAYASPVKPLPAAGIAALVRSEQDWNAF